MGPCARRARLVGRTATTAGTGWRADRDPTGGPRADRAPGLALRLAVTSLGAGVLRYVTEDGTLVEADATTPVAGPGGGPVDVVEGALASASVPTIFPPRRLADDLNVDGGVVNNVPVQAAANLGATRIIAVLAVPLVQPPDHPPPLPPGVEVAVIDPHVDVVGPFEVAQGLMLLDMDYGWLRAADVMAEVGEETCRQATAASDALVTARTQARHVEEAVEDRADPAGRPGDPRAARTDGARRPGHPQRARSAHPPEAARWWSGYEEHHPPDPPGLPDDPSNPDAGR